jgi:hypothetical protein
MKETKGMGERKIYFEESDFDLPTGINENDFHDDISNDGNYFTD